ncbi:MAG: carbohydrate-binding family 9-like protein [Bacteroidales bacterium]
MKKKRREFIKTALVSGTGLITTGFIAFKTDDATVGRLPSLSISSLGKTMNDRLIMSPEYVYNVQRLGETMIINCDWEKSEWKNAEIINIDNYLGKIPGFQPLTKARLIYDDENLYVIFKVEDCFVRCITTEINGPVWQDSCVELFLSPDVDYPERYFNIEINCGGTPLMSYNIIPRKKVITIPPEDIKMMEISHSLPGIVEPEIKEPVTWIIEYKIPLALLEKYSKVTRPANGVIWRGNFYKIAENNSNPHYISWSLIESPVADFHLPQFFGILRFQ